MGVFITIRVGGDLQEDIIVVKDVSEDGVTSVVSHDLHTAKHIGMCKSIHVRIKHVELFVFADLTKNE